MFLGWCFNTGYSWSKGTYLVVDLADFLGCNLHRRAQIEHMKVHVQEVSEILDFDPNAKPDFPLKAQYDWFNSTFEGIVTAMAMDPIIFEKKKERKERDDFDTGLERITKRPKGDDADGRRAKRQARKVERFAEMLSTYDISKDVDEYLRGDSRGQWAARIATVADVPPLD